MYIVTQMAKTAQTKQQKRGRAAQNAESETRNSGGTACLTLLVGRTVFFKSGEKCSR